MDDIRGSPARRLSQILDPIARLASDFGSSSSAPCSPRMGVRGSSRDHDNTCPLAGHEVARSESCRAHPGNSGGSSSAGPDSPRLLPRRGRQAPAPPPRPHQHLQHQLPHYHQQQQQSQQHRTDSPSPPMHFRNSPYVNVPCNLLFQKDKSFADSAKSAGYAELKDASAMAKSTSVGGKCNPYSFSSDSSGRVEYADTPVKRNYAAQTDFGPNSFENKALDVTQNYNRLGRSIFDQGQMQSSQQAGPSSRSNSERTYSFSGRQQPSVVSDERERQYSGESHRLLIERAAATLAGTTGGNVPGTTGGGSSNNNAKSTSGGDPAKRDKLDGRPAYGSSKSFDGYSGTVEELNWQERCLELQLELHRSRSQATRVRDMLREKVSTL